MSTLTSHLGGRRSIALVNRQRRARIAAGLLALHGLIEVAGLLFVGDAAQSLQTFGSLGPDQLAANTVTIALFGGWWGVGRWVAA